MADITTVLGAVPQRITLTDRHDNLLAEISANETARIEWGRDSCAASIAAAAVIATPEIARDLEPWVHRLNVWRGGQLVWKGPVLYTAASGRKLSITASDPGVWFERRRIKQGRIFDNTDISLIAAQLLEDAFSGDDPDRILEQMVVTGSNVYSSVTITPNTRYVSEQLAELAELGLKWQFVAGRLIIGPAVENAELEQPLGDEHFTEPPTVVKDGSRTATTITVLGKSASYTRGLDPSEDQGFGHIDRIIKADAADTVQACMTLAIDELNRNKAARRAISIDQMARLTADAPLGVGDLLPGVRIPIATRSIGTEVTGVMRLVSVRSLSEAGREAIRITVEDAPPVLTKTEIAELVPSATSAFTVATKGGPIWCRQEWEPYKGLILWGPGGKWVEHCYKDGKEVDRDGAPTVDILPRTRKYSRTIYLFFTVRLQL